jgi:hypothetical protein
MFLPDFPLSCLLLWDILREIEGGEDGVKIGEEMKESVNKFRFLSSETNILPSTQLFLF